MDRNTYQICLATAHPAKFSKTVATALKDFQDFDFQNVQPVEFKGLLEKENQKTNQRLKEDVHYPLKKKLMEKTKTGNRKITNTIVMITKDKKNKKDNSK